MPDLKASNASTKPRVPEGLCANPDCRHGKNTRPNGKKMDGHGGKSGRCFCGCVEMKVA